MVDAADDEFVELIVERRADVRASHVCELFLKKKKGREKNQVGLGFLQNSGISDLARLLSNDVLKHSSPLRNNNNNEKRIVALVAQLPQLRGR